MASAPKTIAQILRCSEDQAAAFARRVQEFLGAPVPPDLIAAAMLKVKAKDVASPQRVAEYVNQEMTRQAKAPAPSPARKRATPVKPTGGRPARKKATSTKAKQPPDREGADPPPPADTGLPAEAEVSARERTERVEQARTMGTLAQLERLLEENWAWASAQKLEVPPKRWPAGEFVREVRRTVFTDKSPLPKILKVARRLHSQEWIVTPGAVAQAILDELAAKEGG